MTLCERSGKVGDDAVSSSNLNSSSPPDSIIDVYAASRDLTSSPESFHDVQKKISEQGDASQSSPKPTRIPHPVGTSPPHSFREFRSSLDEHRALDERRALLRVKRGEEDSDLRNTAEHHNSAEANRDHTNSSLVDLYLHDNQNSAERSPPQTQGEKICRCLAEGRIPPGNALRNQQSQTSLRPRTPNDISPPRVSPRLVYHTRIKRLGYPSSPFTGNSNGNSARTFVGFQVAQEHGKAMRTSSPLSRRNKPCRADPDCVFSNNRLASGVQNRSPNSIGSQGRAFQPNSGQNQRSNSGSSSQSGSTRPSFWIEDTNGSVTSGTPVRISPKFYDYTEEFAKENDHLPQYGDEQGSGRPKTATGPDSMSRLRRDPVVNFPHAGTFPERFPNRYASEQPPRSRKHVATPITPTRGARTQRPKHEAGDIDDTKATDARKNVMTEQEGLSTRMESLDSTQKDVIVGHHMLPSSRRMMSQPPVDLKRRNEHNMSKPKKHIKIENETPERRPSRDSASTGTQESAYSQPAYSEENSKTSYDQQTPGLDKPPGLHPFERSNQLFENSKQPGAALNDAARCVSPAVSIFSPNPEHAVTLDGHDNRFNSVLSLGNDSFSDIAARGLNVEVEGRLGMLTGKGGSIPSFNSHERPSSSANHAVGPIRHGISGNMKERYASKPPYGADSSSPEARRQKNGKPRADSATMGAAQREILHDVGRVPGSLAVYSTSILPPGNVGLKPQVSFNGASDPESQSPSGDISVPKSSVLEVPNPIHSAPALLTRNGGGPSVDNSLTPEGVKKLKVKRRSRISSDELENSAWAAFSDYDWANNPQNLGDTLRLPEAPVFVPSQPPFRLFKVKNRSKSAGGKSEVTRPSTPPSQFGSMRNLLDKVKTDSKRSLGNLFASAAGQDDRNAVADQVSGSNGQVVQATNELSGAAATHPSDESFEGDNGSVLVHPPAVFNATKASSFDDTGTNRSNIRIQEGRGKPSRRSLGTESFAMRGSSQTPSASGLSILKNAKCKIKQRCKALWQRGGKKLRNLGGMMK